VNPWSLIKRAFRWVLVTARVFFWPAIPAAALLRAISVRDEDAVARIFDWERERLATLSKGLAGTASAVALAAFGAAFNDKTFDAGDTVTWVVLAVALMLAWATVLAFGVQSLSDQYSSAVVAVRGP
jgi:hypothetical protein